MNFKYHDENGKEIRVTDPTLFAKLVRNGSIQSGTLIFDEQTSIWKRAWEYDEYHSVIANKAAEESQSGATPDYGRAADEYMAYGIPASDQEGISKWALPLSSLMLVAAMGIAMITIFRYSETPFAIGYKLGGILGNVFLFAILAFLVWRFLLNKKKGIGLLLFAACFLGTSLYHWANAFREEQSNLFADEEVSSIVKGIMSGNPIQHRNIAEKKYGSFGPILKIINDYSASVDEAMMNTNSEIEELQLQTLFTRKTLRDTEHIDQGQARLQKALDILDRHEEMLRRYTDEIPQKINSSDAPEQAKREFISGFNAAKEEGLQSLSEFFDIERAFLSKTDDLLNFVRSKKGRYRFVGDEIVFNTQADFDSYKNYFQEILLVEQREREWQTKVLNRNQERLNEMEKALKKR